MRNKNNPRLNFILFYFILQLNLEVYALFTGL